MDLPRWADVNFSNEDDCDNSSEFLAESEIMSNYDPFEVNKFMLNSDEDCL